jgi:CheY-like chemotaxis protein
MRGRRVLVVDDNATNRSVLRHYLTAWGVESEEVADGPQGLAALRAGVGGGQPYDIAILDYQMPGMDGLELAQTIRAEPGLASLKLVLLTSIVQRGEVEQARQAGIDAYLTKPIRPTQLSDCLALMLGQAAVRERQAALLVTAHTVAALQNGQRPLVLVAEDNTFNQKLAVWLLEKLGYRADVAANGQEAVAAVGRIAYTAVFMDCQMPEMDGFEATRLIRQQETGAGKRRTPIIAMTANAVQGDRERCLAVGMDDYLTKPITPEALSGALGRWVGVEEETTEGTPSPAQTTQEVEELVRRVGGDEGLLGQVAELFAVEYPPMVAAVREAMGRQDAGALQRAAHTLKGAVGNLAAQGAYEAAGVLEQLGRAGTVAGGEAALGRLEAEVARFQNFLYARAK